MRCGILKVDRIVINKGTREMLLLRGGSVLRRYRIALGPQPSGHKVQEGDGRTPEGCYRIDRRNPQSRYHLSMRISYPNAADARRARDAGVSPGGDIMIHGLPNDGRKVEGDWTQGCIAVTNAEMDEIWNLVEDGTAVEINP